MHLHTLFDTVNWDNKTILCCKHYFFSSRVHPWSCFSFFLFCSFSVRNCSSFKCLLLISDFLLTHTLMLFRLFFFFLHLVGFLIFLFRIPFQSLFLFTVLFFVVFLLLLYSFLILNVIHYIYFHVLYPDVLQPTTPV